LLTQYLNAFDRNKGKIQKEKVSEVLDAFEKILDHAAAFTEYSMAKNVFLSFKKLNFFSFCFFIAKHISNC